MISFFGKSHGHDIDVSRIEIATHLSDWMNYAEAQTISTIKQIHNRLAKLAREEAPFGDPETHDYEKEGGEPGSLKAHPVDQDINISESITRGFDIPGSILQTRAKPFGGGFSVQAPAGGLTVGGRFFKGGQFIASGELFEITTRDVFITAITTIPEEPRHAIWVHEGTGMEGRFHHPIVARHVRASGKPGLLRFKYEGRKYTRLSVWGQPAQPYLERAYDKIRSSGYLEAKLEELDNKVGITDLLLR